MKPEEKIIEWPSGKLDFSNGCILMGILNVTEDSFSDGGKFQTVVSAVEHGLYMAGSGAAIIDIGAESTRPGAQPVSTLEQIERAVPVIEQLAAKTDIPVSIDTCNVEVAKAAINAGASIINDITALSDPKMAELAAEKHVPVVLMHMKGTPATMQDKPQYTNVVSEVLETLIKSAQRAETFGIEKNLIFIDPGIGFGKTTEHNLKLLKNINRFVSSEYRVLVGASRKNFIGKITGKDKPAERIFGTAATTALCANAGVSILRVHDIAQMSDVVKVTEAMK